MDNLLKGLNIYLIGMMGVGKTTVGIKLAQELNYRFLDTDSLIENISKKSISDIFKEEGEIVFRDLETKILEQVSIYIRSVISTGGGIVLKPHNWSYLHYGLTVWLDAPVNLLVERLAEDDTRPLLKEENLELKLESLLAARKSFYRQADLHILIEKNQTPEQIVSKIIEQIPSKIKPELKANLN
jgi:shikimate kinase